LGVLAANGLSRAAVASDAEDGDRVAGQSQEGKKSSTEAEETARVVDDVAWHILSVLTWR
jgi:hypothetical protein